MKKKSNEEFQRELEALREQGHDIYTDDEYVNCMTTMNFYCSKGHYWPSNANRVISNKQYCPYCLNRRISVGYNDLWTTHREIAVLLQDPQVGYEHTYGSKYRTYFICPFCGNVIFKSIKEVYNRGLSCQKCGDFISYPNKFMRSLLSQLDVENIEYEYSPEWLRPCSFDTYFEFNDTCYALECDGGIGHGNKKYGTNEIDTEGIERDKMKDRKAQEHSIVVLRVDCHYKNKNKYEYIRQHIIDSELANIFDLSCIDWDQCHRDALSSLIYKSAQMYNEGYSIGDISKSLGYSGGTISNWLKQAVQIGLCDYNQIEARRRGRRCLFCAVNQYTKDGIFVQTHESLSAAATATGVNVNSISKCCRKLKYFYTAGGYLWFFIDDETQPDKSQIILNNINTGGVIDG